MKTFTVTMHFPLRGDDDPADGDRYEAASHSLPPQGSALGIDPEPLIKLLSSRGHRPYDDPLCAERGVPPSRLFV